MEETIRIETADRAEALDLIDVLGRRGLCARIAVVRGRSVVELAPGREKPGPLLGDLRVALEGWLFDRKRPSILVRVGADVHLFSAQLPIQG